MKLTPVAIMERYLKSRNLAVIDLELHQKLFDDKSKRQVTAFFKELPPHKIPVVLALMAKSRSQLLQDLFVLSERDFKTSGYFVEFGATNGVALSNSYLLEKDFGWAGIVAEPARQWQPALSKNRTCHIETDCVWRATGETLEFRETDEGELSTISDYSSSDGHAEARKSGQNYPVRTISLIDMLKKYNAPSKIDYLSIDTEGSEFEILQAFDFDQFEFGVITCEHNYTPQRDKIHSLLQSKGYLRTWENASKFDDWYVRA
jgi:FkbM family methyltransferase